jgi:hypothetical protein
MTTYVLNSSLGVSQLATAHITAMKAVNLALATPKVHVDSGALGANPYLVTATNGAGTLAALIKLTKDLIGVVKLHCTDTTGAGPTGSAAHKVVDGSAEFLAIPAASTVVSLATVYTALNAIKAWKTVHCPSTTYHGTADAAYAVTSAADATTQDTGDTLANELKSDFNAHIALALGDMPVLQNL